MISKLANGLLVSLLFSASVAVAKNDYPATDFQPKVLYQDSDYKHSKSTASSSSSRSSGKVSSADSAYPAANFQPEVLYEDSGYKHTKGVVKPSVPLNSYSPSVDVSTSGESSSAEESEDDSTSSLIMGLSVLVVAGFVFYSMNAPKTGTAKRKVKPAKRAKPKARKIVVARGSGSGVDKYLESKDGPIASGVDKYLEERQVVSASGVDKYVAKQRVSAKVAAVTGVEKYLKDKS